MGAGAETLSLVLAESAMVTFLKMRKNGAMMTGLRPKSHHDARN